MYIRKISCNSVTRVFSFQENDLPYQDLIFIKENTWFHPQDSLLFFTLNNQIITMYLNTGLLDFKEGYTLRSSSQCSTLRFEYFKTRNREVKKFVGMDVSYEPESTHIKSVGEIQFERNQDRKIVSVKLRDQLIYDFNSLRRSLNSSPQFHHLGL